MKVVIRESNNADLDNIFKIHSEAFGYDEVAELTQALLADPSAEPRLSLLACHDEQPVGHILFTAGSIVDTKLKISLLAPLAVLPEAQRTGIGGKLINAGLTRLAESDVDLVFVLGHPEYYPRHGFIPAHTYGLVAPYPIPDEVADAWMVQSLSNVNLKSVHGTVICADALNKPEHWRE